MQRMAGNPSSLRNEAVREDLAEAAGTLLARAEVLLRGLLVTMPLIRRSVDYFYVSNEALSACVQVLTAPRCGAEGAYSFQLARCPELSNQEIDAFALVAPDIRAV